MMSLFVQLFIKNKEDVSTPNVKKAYATLSSVAGILLNLFLCTAKIVIGLLSRSVAISADGFNNLSDAGTSLVSLLGFKVAGYGGGSTHPFGHGRMEWIMGYMGVSKASVSVAMKQLRNKDYITMDHSGRLYLSPKGQALASQLYERYNFFISLFSQLGVPIEIAKKDACSIEHVISKESYEKLKCAFFYSLFIPSP